MQQPINNPPCPQNDDEIDLRELWQKLVEGKWMIAITTALATLAAVVYTQVATPIYEGKVSIEIGEAVLNRVVNSTTVSGIQVIPLDNAGDLVKVVKDHFDNRNEDKNDDVDAVLAKQSQKIVDLSLQSPDKIVIQSQLQAAVDFVMQRHEAKAKLYQDVTINPTQQIAPIAFGEKPIKPKSNLIIAVAVVLGLMLGVFGVLVRGAFIVKSS
jgi:LPS O-antigen subunit length determinant protein (WzzB/FepE family)